MIDLNLFIKTLGVVRDTISLWFAKKEEKKGTSIGVGAVVVAECGTCVTHDHDLRLAPASMFTFDFTVVPQNFPMLVLGDRITHDLKREFRVILLSNGIEGWVNVTDVKLL